MPPNTNNLSGSPSAAFEQLQASIIPKLQDMKQAQEKLFDPFIEVIYLLLSELSTIKNRLSESEEKQQRLQHQIQTYCINRQSTTPATPPRSTPNHLPNHGASSSPSSHDPSPSYGSGTPTQPPERLQQDRDEEVLWSSSNYNHNRNRRFSLETSPKQFFPQEKPFEEILVDSRAPRCCPSLERPTERITNKIQSSTSTPAELNPRLLSTSTRETNFSGVSTKTTNRPCDATPITKKGEVQQEYTTNLTTPSPAHVVLPTTPATACPTSAGVTGETYSNQLSKSRLKRSKRRACRPKDAVGEKLTFNELYADDDSPAPLRTKQVQPKSRDVSRDENHIAKKQTPAGGWIRSVEGDSQTRLTTMRSSSNAVVPKEREGSSRVPFKSTSQEQPRSTKPGKKNIPDEGSSRENNEESIKRTSNGSFDPGAEPSRKLFRTAPSSIPTAIQRMERIRRGTDARQIARCQESRRDAEQNGVPDAACPTCEVEIMRRKAQNPNAGPSFENEIITCNHHYIPRPSTPPMFFNCTFPETATQPPE